MTLWNFLYPEFMRQNKHLTSMWNETILDIKDEYILEYNVAKVSVAVICTFVNLLVP